VCRTLKGAATIAATGVLLLLGTVPNRVLAAPIELDYMEYSSDANARAAYVSNSSITATGGTITEVNGYRIHTFTSNGTFTIDVATNVEVLVVAGGGGGGEGGGGAGGLIYESAFAVNAQEYTVTVGAGGAGSSDGSSASSNGDDSVFSSLTATGGGGGGTNPDINGAFGGSGGGGRRDGGSSGGSGTAGQGNAGGTTASGSWRGGAGGGGAGAVGSPGIGGDSGSEKGGNGGNGLSCSISGSAVTYAGGGGGATEGTGGVGAGGTGGGGRGYSNSDSQLATSGTVNTGGGGGGRPTTAGSGTAGSGGLGIVIVRYPSPVLSYSEATIKTQGSYALKSTAPVTTSLNKTLTRMVSPTINLSDMVEIKFDMRAVRTGSNIKIGIQEITPNITSADDYQTVTWDISGVSNANKDVIDQIIVTIANADAANTFYIDNMAVNPLAPPQATGVSGTALGVSSITWNWTDNSSGQYQEDGFKVYCATSSELRPRLTRLHGRRQGLRRTRHTRDIFSRIMRRVQVIQ